MSWVGFRTHVTRVPEKKTWILLISNYADVPRNSNTFVAHIIRNIDELGAELPPHAIGKDWIDDGDLVGWSESGTGFQLSLFGVFGGTLGLAEGVEINLLGMTFGIDFWRPALKLPFIGRLEFADDPVF